MSFLLLPSLENAFWLLGFRRCFPATDLVGDTEKNAQLESLFLTLDTHTRARAHTHTHTHTHTHILYTAPLSMGTCLDFTSENPHPHSPPGR